MELAIVVLVNLVLAKGHVILVVLSARLALFAHNRSR
jgi:hypothetical protein